MLKDKINKAKKKAQKNITNKLAKIHERRATPTNVVLYFNHAVTQIYGYMPTISKETNKKLSGLIKYLKNNGFTDTDIFNWLKEIIENWNEYALKKTTTDRGKEYFINNYPNLNDIIYCKKFFLHYNKEDDNEPKLEIEVDW